MFDSNTRLQRGNGYIHACEHGFGVYSQTCQLEASLGEPIHQWRSYGLRSFLEGSIMLVVLTSEKAQEGNSDGEWLAEKSVVKARWNGCGFSPCRYVLW